MFPLPVIVYSDWLPWIYYLHFHYLNMWNRLVVGLTFWCLIPAPPLDKVSSNYHMNPKRLLEKLLLGSSIHWLTLTQLSGHRNSGFQQFYSCNSSICPIQGRLYWDTIETSSHYLVRKIYNQKQKALSTSYDPVSSLLNYSTTSTDPVAFYFTFFLSLSSCYST